jgi:hypothetical protein
MKRLVLCTDYETPCIVYRTLWNSVYCVQNIMKRRVLCTELYETPCIVYRTSWNAVYCVQNIMKRPVFCTEHYETPCILYRTLWNAVYCVQNIMKLSVLCTEHYETSCIVYRTLWNTLNAVQNIMKRTVLCTEKTVYCLQVFLHVYLSWKRPTCVNHVALINAKSDGYGLYSYHKITQLDMNPSYCHRETNLLEDSSCICPMVELAVFSCVQNLAKLFVSQQEVCTLKQVLRKVHQPSDTGDLQAK